ncbi:MAG: hypothetical protein C4527_17395 [Candidatus Omnitrophota bacterium]|jgi:hypothetical protein|nr:MAG: hypothetical protein C4527_17395 [Candidatus Omnitrophota bacterium]
MRTVSLACALLLASGVAFADRAMYDPTKTQAAMPLSTPPTIDGVIDLAGGESWIYAGGAKADGTSYWKVVSDLNLDDEIRGGMLGAGTEAPIDDTDLSFQIWAGHDSNYLYIAVRVWDDFIETDSAAAGSANGSTWEDDSVEVFIDGDNSNFPTRDTTGTNPEVVGTGGQYVITANNAYREAEAGNPGYGPNAAWYALTTLRADGTGYDAEFRISMDIIGNPERGDIIGFTVAVNEDDFGGGNQRQLIWVGSTHVEESYGNLVIGPRRYVAPKTSAPTIDGVINASEYAGAEEIAMNTYTVLHNIDYGNDEWPLGDHDFSAWVVHDDEAVYVAVNVIDDILSNDSAAPGTEDGNTWEDDAVEIFFDADYSKDRGRGAGEYEGQYVFTANGAWRDNEANNPLFGENDDWFAAHSVTDSGYQVEFKVTKFALFDVADGSMMGFNISIDDEDVPGENAKIQILWNGFAHVESTYGDLVLSPGGSSVGEWSLH